MAQIIGLRVTRKVRAEFEMSKIISFLIYQTIKNDIVAPEKNID